MEEEPVFGDVTFRGLREKFGDELVDKMINSGWFMGITVTKNEAGEFIIPADDIYRAYRAVKGKPIYDWD